MQIYKETIDEKYYIRPQVVNEKIKLAQSQHQTIYLYGSSGVGKTSFIKDYFRNKHYVYLSAYNLTVQDMEFEINSRPLTVVIDDLYLLEPNAQDEAIKKKIIQLAQRRDIWLILINRCKIPKWLTASYLKNIFKIVEEKDFYLSKKEVKKYFSLWHIVVSEDDFIKIMRFSIGIAIAVKIIAIHLSRGEVLDKESIRCIKDELCNYLEEHVYENWEPEIMEFLMQLCIVERFNEKLGEMITGATDFRYMIERTKEIGNFIKEEVQDNQEIIYTIRSYMRYSMLRKMECFYTKERKNQLYYNAGMYYELEGDTPNALLMYKKCGNSERISNLLIANSRKNPASGYYHELKEYYLELPEDTIRRHIELMSAMSMLQSILMNIDESERWYEELASYAVKQTGRLRKEARSKQIYLDISLPHRGSKGLIEILKSAAVLLCNRDINMTELAVTSNLPSMMNGGKDFCEWSKRDKELANSIGRLIEMVLGKYGKGLVNLALAESYFEKGEDAYQIAAYANRGKMQAEAGGKLEQCFVANGILVWLDVLKGNATEGMELLKSFHKKVEYAKEVKMIPNILAFEARLQMYCGETSKVTKWMKSIPNEEIDFCVTDRFRYLTKVRGYLMADKLQKADALLQRLLIYSEMMHRTYINIEVHILLAITQYRLKNKEWVETLSKGMEKAEEYHFVRVVSREGTAIWELLQSKECHLKDNAFVKQVLMETEKMARFYPSYLKEQTEKVDFNEHAIQILKLQSQGMSIAQIAENMGMTVANTKYHCQQTYKKLGVNGKAAAVIEARRRNII